MTTTAETRLSALGTLGRWNVGRALRANNERQYPRMNDFLEKIVALVTECEGIVACSTSSDADGCVIDTIEAHNYNMRKEVQRAATRPSMTRSRLFKSDRSAAKPNKAGKKAKKAPKAKAEGKAKGGPKAKAKAKEIKVPKELKIPKGSFEKKKKKAKATRKA